MRNLLNFKTQELLKRHRFNRRWKKTVTAFSIVTAIGMSYALVLPAVTMGKDTYCGYEEHVEHNGSCYTESKVLVCGFYDEGHIHSDDCYEEQRTLLCEIEENDGHVHSDDCYSEQLQLSCGMDESDGHIHSEICFDEDGEVICGFAEGENSHYHDDSCYMAVFEEICGLAEGEGAHYHDESCYTIDKMFVCGREESEPHVHDDSCYMIQDGITCTIPLHEHDLQCYSNPEADVESQDVWERTVSRAELSGILSEDVIAIAKTQIGYEESERNYIVADDGFTKKGYTRYGDWYGDTYGDWCAMFCSFCLHYAGVDAKKMPRESNCGKWIGILTDRGLYHEYESGYEPEAGDLIFMDWDGDGEANHVGFVYEVSEDSIKTIEGNKADQVKYDQYDVIQKDDDTESDSYHILGYGELQDNGITISLKAAGTDSSSVDLASRTDNKTGETYYVTAYISTDKTSYKPGDTVTVTMILANTDPKNGVSGKNIMQYLEFSFYKGNTPLAENTFSFGKVDLGADSELSHTFTYTIPQNAADEDTELKMTVRSTSNNINWNPFTSLMTDNTAQCSTPLIIKAPENVYVESASNNGSNFPQNADGTLNIAFDLKNYQVTDRGFAYSLKVEAAESMGGAKTDITSGLESFAWTGMPGIASETETAANGSGTMPAANNGPAEAQAAVQTTLSDSLYGNYNAFYVTLTVTDTTTGETSAQTAVVPRFKLDLSNYTFRFRDDTAGNSIPNYVSKTGLDWLDTLYYGLVEADDDVPFNNAEEFKTFLASQPDEATANSFLQKYIYDLYEPHVGVSGNYGDANLDWPKDSKSPFHVQPTSQVNPMGTYTLADAGIDYGDEYFKNSNKTVTVAEEAGAGDRAYQLDLTTETDPRLTNPSVYVIMVPTMWQMFDEAHATAQKGGKTKVGSILTSVDEMAYLYDIKHALIRFAEYLKDQGSNAGVAIVNTQHGGDYSMIQGNSRTKTGYFTTDMDQLIEAIEGWDAYGDCEHVHWSQDQLNNAMASIPNTFSNWKDADDKPVSIDSVVKNMVVIAGPTENSNGTNGYGSKLTEGKYGNVDYVWGIRTDTGTSQVSINNRSIYSWLDTEANQNTIKANNSHYTSMDDPNNPAYQICTSEDAIYEQLVNIFNYDKSATSSVKGTVENVTLEDIVTKEFSVKSAVVTVTYLDDEGEPTGVVDTITMTDQSKGEIILEENPDGTTTVKGVVNKIEGRAVVDMKINIEAQEDFIGSNNVKTNSGTPKVSYEHGDEEYSEDFDDEPKVNVPIKFEVPDGLTVTVNAGETVDVDGDLPYKAEDKSETIVQDVQDLFDKGYQVNGTLIFQWYDENGQPVPGTTSSSCRVDNGKLEKDDNGNYIITIPDFDCPTDASDIGTTKTYKLVVTFEPDPAVEGSVGTEVLTKSDAGSVWINVGEPEDPDNPIIIPELPDVPEPPKWTPELDPDLEKQIDYLGDNVGTANNPDTTLDDGGVAGLEDLYRLYLNLQGDSEGIDLVLVLDASNSMGTPMGNSTRRGNLLDFLNGTGGDPGFVTNFLAAHPDNRLSVVTFGYNAIQRLGWTQVPEMITLPSQGTTNYVSGLYLADELLHDGALAGSENQKLVIFLGDGEVTDGYYDGQLHNEVSGTFIHEGEANMSLEETVEVMLLDLLYGDLADAGDPYLCINSLGGIQERVYTCDIRNTQPETMSTVRFLRDLGLDLNQIPGYENGVITDFDALENFVFYYYELPSADKVDWIYSISTAELPTRTCDLYETTKYAFLEFMDSNPDVCVHTVGFSSEINVPKTDMLGVQKTGLDVLQYMAQFGGGEYHYADSAQTLAEEINSICFMTNTEMTDTLSAYVQAAEAPELKVVQKAVDGSSEVVLYENGTPTEAGAGVLESVDLDRATGKITVKFLPTYPVSPEHIYSASFNVQLKPEVYTQFVADGCTYPDVGDPNTDYGNNSTSTGNPGYFSNAGGKVTWTAGEPDEKVFPHPVVQVYEGFLYKLPETGGKGTAFYTIGSIGLMSSALIFGFITRRKKFKR